MWIKPFYFIYFTYIACYSFVLMTVELKRGLKELQQTFTVFTTCSGGGSSSSFF